MWKTIEQIDCQLYGKNYEVCHFLYAKMISSRENSHGEDPHLYKIYNFWIIFSFPFLHWWTLTIGLFSQSFCDIYGQVGLYLHVMIIKPRVVNIYIYESLLFFDPY